MGLFDSGLFWALGLAFQLTKAALHSLSLLYPSYKTYKALESRRLRDAHALLLYWCIWAFTNALKDAADQLLGTYSNVVVWKMTVLGLKAAPLIIGPDRLYNVFVKPLYSANSPAVDAVVSEAHKVREVAKQAVPAVKEGDVSAVREHAEELVEAVKEAAAELGNELQEKSAKMGVRWNKEGVVGVLDLLIQQFESLRDVLLSAAGAQWESHGPTVVAKSRDLSSRALRSYRHYQPIVRARVLQTYQGQVAPRVEPAINRAKQTYAQQIRPTVAKQGERARQAWQQYGGPARRLYASYLHPFYLQQARPFVSSQLLPFLRDSLWPAVVETLHELRNRLFDLLSEPSDAVRHQRAQAKKQRRQRAEERAEWRKRGQRVKSKWADSWKEAEQGGPPQQPAKADERKTAESKQAETAEAKSHGDSTLTHRKSAKGGSGSGNESASVSGHASASAAAPTSPPSPQPVWSVSKSAGIAHESGLPTKEELLQPEADSQKEGQAQAEVTAEKLSEVERAHTGKADPLPSDKDASASTGAAREWAGERSARHAQPIQ